MHRIKKYANRKMYDTTAKKYISMDQLSELIKSVEEVSITDNITGFIFKDHIFMLLLSSMMMVNNSG